MEDSDAEDDVTMRNLETAKTVYANVRHEFLAWKAKHVAQVLNRPSAAESTPTATGSAIAEQFSLPPDAFSPPPDIVGQTDTECIHSRDYDADGKVIKSEHVPVVVVKADLFVAHQPYQFCTPTSRNVTASMINNKSASYIPYPDDKHFPREEYLSFFVNFQWQEDQRDPDDEVMEFETVRRLHIEHGFSAQAIDDVLGVYSNFRRLRLSNESGLLWDASQRDLPDVIWGDGVPSSNKPKLPLHFAQNFPAPNNIFKQINNGLAKFCPNLNCIVHNCHVHISTEWEGHLMPPLTPKQALLTSVELFEQPGEPCGEECFRHLDPDDMEDQDGSINALAFLAGVLKLDPDILPCDLAIICKLPCRQVFFYRRDLVDDNGVLTPDDSVPVYDPPPKKRPRKRPQYGSPSKRKKAKAKTDFTGVAPPIPCTHLGPCSAHMNCECFKTKAYCERNCRCPANCPRRWPGCNSSCSNNTGCRTRKCRCRDNFRECDPELCTACDARDTHVYYPAERRQAIRCENMELQRPEFKHYEIRRSKFGLGAFAAENISRDDVIGEYVGELLDDTGELKHHGVIQRHSGLNYSFDMGFTPVDAQWIGNPTRFLNDSKPRNPNCAADGVHIVNGELRLIIRALKKITKGTELTLSYGDLYWNGTGHGPGTSSASRHK